MIKGTFTLFVLLGFLTGIGVGFFFQSLPFAREQPLSLPSGSTYERLSPYDHIKESQIKVEDNKIVISLDGQEVGWSRYTGSNSMDQTLDEGHNGLEIKPKHTSDIHAGDIIAFKYNNNLVVHRVVEIGTDQYGWYARTKGDNNGYVDPGKRRFEDVERLTIGILY